MTLDVYVQTWHTAIIFTNSVIRLQMLCDKEFSVKPAQNSVFSFEKCNSIFFSWSPVPPRMGKKHLEHIFSGVLEGLADSTMELIESRCGGTQ